MRTKSNHNRRSAVHLISVNDGGMVSWGLDTDNLSTSRNLINTTNDE